MLRKKNLKKFVAFLFMVILMASQILYTHSMDVFADSGDTITTNITSGFIQKAYRKTVDVWARNAAGEKIESNAFLDGNEVDYNWNDYVKTSYTFDFSDCEDGLHTITITAGSAVVNYEFTLQKAADGEFIGYATFSLEAFTICNGYLVKPKLVPIYQGENSAQVLLRYLEEEGFGYGYTGQVTNGFYLAEIFGTEYSRASRLNPAPRRKIGLNDVRLEENVENGYGDYINFDETDCEDGRLGEFDFCSGSGWMYSVNNNFPNVGFADYYLSPDDVVRIQFTVCIGVELGEVGYSPEEPAYTTADKGELTALMASVNSSEQREALIENDDVLEAMNKAEADCQNLACSQEVINADVASLRDALNSIN
ncbi:protein of unknown function [Acetitomaculum ruminis DSM 5522]|uniref:Transcobalamin-like C-terminal domain-containing protein n=1 Tax=Acetitomaculum ruminis DSM 5522 TaxID=1120918 RepID=A0A1I0W768_9FIRM|nr:DUF4430 domain-containing protein [Acetitomaculum ruminis]SFA84384.1 protein of unknown function [Acetitomaculum ruminis DSM 5522]